MNKGIRSWVGFVVISLKTYRYATHTLDVVLGSYCHSATGIHTYSEAGWR